MITLVDSPGDPSANSYASLAFSNAHMEQSVGRSDWAIKDLDIRHAALIEATRTIDSMFTWFSISTDQFQALDWPQQLQYDKFGRRIPDTVIPDILKRVTCDLAYNILSYGGTAQAALNVDSVKVGPISLDLDQSSSERFFETIDFSSLGLFGDFVIKKSGTAHNVKVYR